MAATSTGDARHRSRTPRSMAHATWAFCRASDATSSRPRSTRAPRDSRRRRSARDRLRAAPFVAIRSISGLRCAHCSSRSSSGCKMSASRRRRSIRRLRVERWCPSTRRVDRRFPGVAIAKIPYLRIASIWVRDGVQGSSIVEPPRWARRMSSAFRRWTRSATISVAFEASKRACRSRRTSRGAAHRRTRRIAS